MISILLLAFITSVLSSNQVCPGGSFSCPDFATCCQLADLSYGCCPMQNAVCCDDHIHCCPTNTKCDAGICIQLDGLNATSHKLTKDVSKVICPGGKYECMDGNTCCKGLDPGVYGCCPFEHAVCCTDGKHCCPEGTVCNIQAQHCDGKGFITEMFDSSKHGKIYKSENGKYSKLVKSQKLRNVICPGSEVQCPNGYTCCTLPSGSYGCCPYERATCCADHLHCCPENMKCDSSSKACIQSLTSIPVIPVAKKVIAEPITVGLMCPDNTTCSDGMTCCVIGMERFGCCVYPNAVCCPDQQHCCPAGNFCDEVEKKCVPNKKWLSKKRTNEYEVNYV